MGSFSNFLQMPIKRFWKIQHKDLLNTLKIINKNKNNKNYKENKNHKIIKEDKDNINNKNKKVINSKKKLKNK